MTTKADAKRWLDSHVGRTIDTSQPIASNGRTWAPGPRTLAKRGAAGWQANGSSIVIDRTTVVTDVSADALVLEWRDEDGTLIHTTTYTAL